MFYLIENPLKKQGEEYLSCYIGVLEKVWTVLEHKKKMFWNNVTVFYCPLVKQNSLHVHLKASMFNQSSINNLMIKVNTIIITLRYLIKSFKRQTWKISLNSNWMVYCSWLKLYISKCNYLVVSINSVLVICRKVFLSNESMN